MTRRRVLWLVVALVLAVALAGALALLNLATLVRHAAVWRLQALTGRVVVIDALDLSLASGRFSVRGFRVADHDGGRLAEFERLEGRAHPRALLQGHLRIDELTLTGGHLRIVRLGPDRFNVSDLLDRPPAGQTLAVSVDHLAVAGGSVELEDRMLQPARTWRSDDLRMDARDVTTLGRRGTLVGSTTVAGALITLRVDELQLAPLHLRAWINVRDLDLRLVALYLPADGPVVFERGRLDAGVTVVVDATDGSRLDADAVIGRLALRRPGMEGDALTAPELQVLVRDLHQRPGAVALRYASVGGDLTVLDPTTTPPRRLVFTDFTATASGLEQPMTGLAQLAIHGNVPGGGEMDIGGTAGLTPRQADLRVRARGLELAALNPYLPIAGRLDGRARADVRVRATHEPALGLTVGGDATLERFTFGDGARTLVGASRLSAGALQYTWPATLRVGQLTVSQPTTTVERDEAGAIGLAALIRRPAEPAAGAPAPALDVGIARLKIEDGRAVISDAASGVQVEARRIALTAEDLVWPGPGPARVRVAAAVGGTEVSAQGTVDAGQRRADLALRLRGADLAALQPWLPLAGRVRGAADADVRVVASAEDALRVTVTGDAALQRLALLDGPRTLAAAARVAAGGVEYAWPATIRVAQLTVTQPSATVERDAAGGLGIVSALRPAPRPGDAPTPAAGPGAQPPATVDLAIERLRIDGGSAVVTDAASGGRVEIARLAATAEDVTWPARGDARVRLSAAVAGGEVTARGTVDAARRRGEIALTVRGADIATLQPWLPIVGRVRGAAHADVTVSAALDPFAPIVRGTLGATDLAFLDAAQPLLTVGRVDASGVDLQWPSRLAIDRLRVDAPWARIERNPQGELSLRALFARRPDLPAAAPAPMGPVIPGPVPGLQVSVRDALFENGSSSIVDDAVEPAARFELRGSRLALRDLTWPARGPAAIQISTPMPGRGGTLQAHGTFSIEPTRLALEVDLDQVDLAPGRPYLPIDARLNGRVSGRAKVDGTFGDTVTLTIDGDAAVQSPAFGDAVRPLAAARRAELGGFHYRFPAGISIRQLTLHQPWLLLERSADGRLQLVSLLTTRRTTPGPTAAPAPAGGAATPGPGVRVQIDGLRMDAGFVRFVDRSTEPDYAEELSAITLTAEGLGTEPAARAKVALRGTFASGAPLSLQGELGGLLGPRFLDVTVDVRDFPVPRLNPYLQRQLGWLARQGTLTAAVHYRISGDDLDATNDVTITGLEVERPRGDQPRNGPPLDTIVSLLKNREGVIHLNVPVRGSLSAPEFDYGDAMWAAMRNLVIRLVALPFSLVGKLFFTEDSNIRAVAVAPVAFQAGQATPTPAGAQQIDQVAKFMQEAPAVRMRLRPVATVADVGALRRAALDARLAAPGADAAARRRAAVSLYAELFPRRQPPASDEALLEELTRETPTPAGALRALAAQRVTVTREALVRAGIAPERLEAFASRTAVESEGTARVEFEITH